MTRIGKKEERRARSPRKHKKPSIKTGPKKDNLPEGYKPKVNAYAGARVLFVPKIKSVGCNDVSS